MNRRYFGIYYIEGEKNGETIREYAEKPSRVGDGAEVTNTVKAGRTSNSMAYVVTTIGTNGKDAWEIEHINTFIKRSVIDGVKNSISASEKEEIDEEGIESKGINEIVEVEMNDVTYGDDYFEYKIKGENLNKKGTSNFVEITSKLDFNVQWDFGSSGLSSKSMSSLKKGQKGIEITSVKDNATATVYIGTYSKSLTFNVDELEITEGVSAGISVSDYKVDRVSDINSLAVKATVQYGASGKRVNEKSYEFTPMIVGSGFGEWTATVTGSGNFSGTITTTFNITQNVYKITKGSIVNGDITISPTESPCNETITLTNTAKTGYKFVNYIVDGTEQTENAFIMPNKNIVVGANFTAENYKITYETNGGTFNGTKVESYDYGVGATLSTNLTKTGYTFEGWYTSSNLSGTAVTKIGTTETGDKTLYAKWTAKSDVSYTVHYYISGTTTKVADDKVVSNKTFNASETIYPETVTGYTATQSSQLIKHDAYNKVYTFYYTANTYTITYYSTNTTAYTTQSIKYASSYSLPTAPTKDGFVFVGWSQDENNTYEWSSGTQTCSGNKSWYAVWKKTWKFYDTSSSTPTYEVNYAYNSATNQSYSKGNPTLSGYSFQGYATSSTATEVSVTAGSGSTSVSSTSATPTFYAVWLSGEKTEENTTYPVENTSGTITYNGNGNTGGATSSTTVSISTTYTKVDTRTYNTIYNYNLTSNENVNYSSWTQKSKTVKSVSRSATLASNGFSKTGHDFSKWAEGSASGTQYSAGATYTGASTTFYAIWTKSSYTVTLNTNSGTINAGNVTSYTYGTGATLPTNVTRSGYTFNGWYASSDFSGSVVTSIGSTETGNKTYWAKWTINYTVTLKYYVDYGTGTTSLSNVTTTLLINGTSTGERSSFSQALMKGTTVGVNGVTHNTNNYAWQFYKIGEEVYSIYQLASNTNYRVTVNGDLEIGIYLSGKVNYRQNIISNHTVNLAGVYKSSDYIEGFDKGGVRDINGDFYMEVLINNLAGSQSYTGNDWASMAWRTFLLGFYDSYNPDCYRFIRLDNWSWTSYSCGTWIYDINGSRDSSNWWDQMTTAQVMSLYRSGNMSLDIRITKVGNTMHVIYAVRHNGSEYRQYFKFTNMPDKLSMLYGAEDANFTVAALNLDIKDNSVYSYVGSTTGTGKTYGLGNGWNDNRNLFDIPRLAGNFTVRVEYKMTTQLNGDSNTCAHVQPTLYTPGDLYKRAVFRIDWCFANNNQFISTLSTVDNGQSSGFMYKCNGWDGTTTGFDADLTDHTWETSVRPYFLEIIKSATVTVEFKRVGSDLYVRQWIDSDLNGQRYGVWHDQIGGCPTGIVGFRLMEQSSTYTVTSYSITYN